VPALAALVAFLLAGCGGPRVSVVEQPLGKVTAASLQRAQAVFERRLDGLGVTGSTVSIEGHEIVIELPEARDTDAVLEVVGQTDQLFFRPVDCVIAPYEAHVLTAAASSRAGGASGARADATAASLGASACGLSTARQEAYLPPHSWQGGVTRPVYDTAGATVVLPFHTDYVKGKYVPGERFVLGPAELTGAIVQSAAPNLDAQTNEWEVDMTFTAKGDAEFNRFAARHYHCYEEDPSNPPFCAEQAIELDAVVESNPVIEAASFPWGATISGSAQGPFTAKEAADLADALNWGALPVPFAAREIPATSPARPASS
jgi:preprotein translocase subunit SecD